MATLRGEIGASRIETRVAETILAFTRRSMQGRFEKIKDYMGHELETLKGRWAKAVNKYRQELNLTWQELREIGKKDLKAKVRDWDTKKW